VGTLHQHGVGWRRAQLAARPEGQRKKVEGAVEPPRPPWTRELEHVVAPRRALHAARQDAHVEPLGERVELGPEALVEGQPVTRPADHQEARLAAHLAARPVWREVPVAATDMAGAAEHGLL
jgi:hypothetical protein